MVVVSYQKFAVLNAEIVLNEIIVCIRIVREKLAKDLLIKILLNKNVWFFEIRKKQHKYPFFVSRYLT